VAEGVVVALEAVEVEDRQQEAPILVRGGKRHLQIRHQPASVPEPREGVGHRGGVEGRMRRTELEHAKADEEKSEGAHHELGQPELDLPGDEFATLLQAASLHDVGKVAVPDAILAKPGALDDDEWAFIRQHTLIGERILSVAPALTGAARLVRASHERIDGSGYPDGRKGEEIPLGARIIAVCDAFDAMTSPRPYRTTPLSIEGAVTELQNGAGTQFDAKVVEVFSEILREQRHAKSEPAAVLPQS
jgi:HD-GYP domain-containing protein (c-di-GMP phosphodiesterase class II)